MSGSDQLRAEDLPDFERVVRQALDRPDIADAIRSRAGAVTADQLRTRILQASDAITVEAAVEYRAYLRLRTAAARPDAAVESETVDRNRAGLGRGLTAALAVLVPGLASMAAAIFVLLGYLLRLAHSHPRLADELITSGWIAAVIAVVPALAGLSWLLVAAARNRSSSDGNGHPSEEGGEVARARDAWQRALLERGMVPFLQARLQQPRPTDGSDRAAPPKPPPAANRADGAAGDAGPRLRQGSTEPDHASPDFGSPGSTALRSPGAE